MNMKKVTLKVPNNIFNFYTELISQLDLQKE
jgi:hypothetical protein